MCVLIAYATLITFSIKISHNVHLGGINSYMYTMFVHLFVEIIHVDYLHVEVDKPLFNYNLALSRSSKSSKFHVYPLRFRFSF